MPIRCWPKPPHSGDNFNPNDEAFDKEAYNWVADYAPLLWYSRLASFHKLDDRASSLLTWVGGGAAVFTAGITLALADNKLHWGIAAAFAPSVFCAGMSCSETLYSPVSSLLFPQPDVRECIDFVEKCYPKGRIASLSLWHKAITGVTIASNNRAIQISPAIWWTTWAVLLLCLPFGTALGMVAYKANTTPTATNDTAKPTPP